MSVQTLRARLTQDDIRRLADAADEEGRALAARKVCARFAAPDLSDQERALGAEIVRILAADAAEMVRRALSVTLQRSPYLPADVARRLAADVDSIAVPIIAGSPVLDDADLTEIVRKGGVNQQVAVASREAVSEAVVAVLVHEGDRAAVKVAAANDGARFDTGAFQAALSRFDDDPDVLDRFVNRSSLPLEITEKLISRISDHAIQALVRRHALPPQLAVELAEGARERATVDLVDQAGLSDQPRRFVQQLQLNGRLTPSLMIRALMRGHMTFFEHCVAELAAIDHAKAWVLIHDAGALGLEAAFKRAGLPAKLLPVTRAALASWHSLEIGPGGQRDIVRFRRLLAERVLTQFQGVPQSELEYILDRLESDEAELAESQRAAG